jgi:hypothetical protein
MVYAAAGRQVFFHECEGHGPHEIAISWGGLDQGLIYPELDLSTHAKCAACGALYEPHDCAAAHRVDPSHRCDDHTAGLVALPEPDPDDVEQRRLQLLKWMLEQKTVIANMEKLLEAGNLDQAHQIDAQLTLLAARRALKNVTQESAQ